MLTPEQIKNLKVGDPLLIHGTFVKTHADGDIQYESPYTGPDDKISNTYRSTIPSCVSLPESRTVEITLTPTPKYDPCRIFQRGDKVRVKREVNGRPVYIGEDAWEPLDPEEIWTVVEEKETGWVELKYCCVSADVWHGMLELVTPVEEMEPYEVTESSDYYGVGKDDLEEEAAIFWKKSHPNAKAAAEAECARLNAEHRKERQ